MSTLWRLTMGELVLEFQTQDASTATELVNPYGQPGDLIWIREAFRCAPSLNDTTRVEYRAGGWKVYGGGRGTFDAPHWYSSASMPLWAARACRFRVKRSGLVLGRSLSAPVLEALGAPQWLDLVEARRWAFEVFNLAPSDWCWFVEWSR